MTEPDFVIPTYRIPTEKVDLPFAQVIRAIQNLEIYGPRKLNEIEMFLMQHCVAGSDTILHWATKIKWNSSHKIPGGQAHVRATKPVGVIVAREIELCIQCHAGVGYKRAGHQDASIWFGELWRESLKINLNDLFTVTTNGGGKKAGVIGLRQDVLAALKGYRNPFDPSVRPQLHNLIECSIYLAERGENFRKQYWSPYIRSLSAWATQLDSNLNGYYQVLMGRVVRKKGRVFFQVCKPLGQGKGLRVLFEKEVGAETIAV